MVRGVEVSATGRKPARIEAFQVHEGEAAGVPDLVGEVAVAGDALLGEAHVPAHGGEGGQGKTEGVGAVFIHEFQGIDDVALGLAHLLAFRVPHQGVDVDLPEGDFPHEVNPHHHHPGHPEKEDVEGGDQDARWGKRA